MHVYLSADIEGITGIAHWDEAAKAHADYAWFRDRMTAEVAAACEGALDGGATRITVKDAHGTGRNLVADELPAPTRLIRGWSGHPYAMVQELDRDVDALVFVGYHSPAGSGGHPLAHTMSGRFARVELDGVRVSEFRLNSLTARSHGVPTVFLSGDEALCSEARELEPHLLTLATHRGSGHSTVALHHPDEVLAQLRSEVGRAVSLASEISPSPMPESFDLVVRFRRVADALKASFYPGAEAVDDEHVRLRTDAWLDVLTAMRFW